MELSRRNVVPLCPSSQPDVEGAAVFAIMRGTAYEPRAGYLDRVVPLTREIAAMAAPVSPQEVFRISAPCAAHACQHFADGMCGLAQRLVQLVDPVKATAPPCAVRRSCRWWLQEGIEACLRCPQVVTHMYGASTKLARAASPTDGSL